MITIIRGGNNNLLLPTSSVNERLSMGEKKPHKYKNWTYFVNLKSMLFQVDWLDFNYRTLYCYFLDLY